MPFEPQWDQFKPMPVTPETLELWEGMAKACFPNILAGQINWPMIVNSLITHIRKTG